MLNDQYFQARPHPWHGLEPGPDAPAVVEAYIEITPFDLVKYEIDKRSGYLRVDRAQRTSSLPPSLYGFVPRTLAADRVGGLMEGAEGGDDDPLDICVLSERPIARAEVLVRARVVGGIPMLDGGLADDKIIGILDDDPVYGHLRSIEEIPDVLVGRLLHYFSTYKLRPESAESVEVGDPYGIEHARAVIEAALADYVDAFGVGD
ncbi:MAG: inorganic pyrophosphatase [Gemmatimonadetes bacterium]|nr:inorganic pyrophosphatase [Gemmatimonadota bacterium]NNF15050.1 inorganic pyrophosphatase [Gemmatimonadota bacterium]